MSIKSMATALTLVAALFSQASLAVLPPLSQNDREAMATDIVSGYVMSTKKEIVDAAYGTDAVYTVKLMVLSSSKGGSVPAGETLQFTYWKADDRPHGWCGNGGQYNTIKKYTSIKAYLVYDETTDQYTLLSPNGFDLDS